MMLLHQESNIHCEMTLTQTVHHNAAAAAAAADTCSKAPSGSRKLPYAKAIVTSSSGNKAEVLKANVHVGTVSTV